MMNEMERRAVWVDRSMLSGIYPGHTLVVSESQAIDPSGDFGFYIVGGHSDLPDVIVVERALADRIRPDSKVRPWRLVDDE